MLKKRFEKICDIVDAASPGPWVVVNRGTPYDWDVFQDPKAGREIEFLGYTSGMFARKEDADFIVMARWLVPELIDDSRRTSKRLNEQSAALENIIRLWNEQTTATAHGLAKAMFKIAWETMNPDAFDPVEEMAAYEMATGEIPGGADEQ